MGYLNIVRFTFLYNYGHYYLNLRDVKQLLLTSKPIVTIMFFNVAVNLRKNFNLLFYINYVLY